jgi:energy-coupling factor transporter ATP-binding protein EcfA2
MSLAENVAPPGRERDSWPAIERLSVKGLFGRYSYLDLSLGGSGSPRGSVALLYGDNGSGKTTLLKLLYSCLCPASNEGHRTYLSKTPFASLKVEFHDGDTIEIVKNAENLVGSYVYRIHYKGDLKELYINARKDHSVATEDENPDIRLLHAELAKLQFNFLFLQDDRTIKSTYPLFSNVNFNLILRSREAVINEEALTNRQRYILRDYITEEPRQSPEEENLSRVIAAVGEWLRQSAFQKSSTGDEDASNVYLNVINALAHSGGHPRLNRATKHALVNQLEALNRTAGEYRRYGLVGAYPIDEFMKVVIDAPDFRVDDIAALLTPYIDSVLSRLNAMAELKSIISAFENEINGYLKDKRAEIHLPNDLRFFDDAGSVLSPNELSRGERQLSFLFCAALLSRAGRTIFMIDEPELSLNVKWQRRLVSSLVNLGRGATTQFIMATHSIEIMARHRDAIIALG